MAQINFTNGELNIKIADPVELERLIVVLHRTKSTKVAAIREAIIAATTPQPEAPKPTTPVEVLGWSLEVGDTIVLEDGTQFKIDAEDDSSCEDHGEAIFFDAQGNAVGFGPEDTVIKLV